MRHATATAIFQTDLASSGKTAPEWIELFPAGPSIKARDGRAWTLDPNKVLAAFAANNGPLAIDYEHAQAHKAPKGDEAPAAGWIVDLEERAGGVWGRVEWVAKAARQIVNREYRFISPDFNHDRNGLITRLNGAGLVNRPALVMTALAQEQHQKETPMPKAIALALGLAETADEVAILSAIAVRDDERKATCQALNIEETGDHAAIVDAVQKLKDDTATALAAVQSGSDVASIKAELVEAKTALAQLQQKDVDREIDLALDTATKEGKITPASRESYRAICAGENGLDRFNALVKTLPPIVDPSGLDNNSVTTKSEGGLDPVALASEARAYVKEQADKGINITASQAVAHVKAKHQ
ncbi:phage protease [Brucella anthropi]|uniref:phage protease n=1 Tax=Brucella anthropi TaxID=529 RepID=UPI0023629F14|nr:phage protease [Brucella anthropi]